MQQLGPRLKRINSISIQVIYKDLMRQEATQQEHKGDGGAATCQAVVGGGAGLGTWITLTSSPGRSEGGSGILGRGADPREFVIGL